MKIKVFHEHDSLLAESPIWHRARYSLMWVDILRNELWEKSMEGQLSYWRFEYIVTAVFECRESKEEVWLVTDKGIIKYNLITKISNIRYPMDYLPDIRPNDAGVLADGRLVFGTMKKSPTSDTGMVFSVDKVTGINLLLQGIGIPNTFVSEGENLYISDSLQKSLFRCNINELLSAACRVPDIGMDCFYQWEQSETPDGGCLDSQHSLWNAIWGGSKVVSYDGEGRVLSIIDLPVPQPTSCCIGGPNNNLLFITTASSELSTKQLKNAPLSGSVFYCELDNIGIDLPYLNL